MCELGLAVSAEGVVIGLLGESEGIEEPEGFDGTDEGVDDGGSGDGRGGLLLGEGRKGGGRSDGGEEGGGGEFHLVGGLVGGLVGRFFLLGL